MIARTFQSQLGKLPRDTQTRSAGALVGTLWNQSYLGRTSVFTHRVFQHVNVAYVYLFGVP